MRISFFVPGIPAPGGSKRFVGFGKKTGRAILIDDAGQRNKDWRSSVGFKAAEAMQGRDLFTGPLQVSLNFTMPRIKSHFGKKGLKENAPTLHVKKPDALKLSRSTEDAMTGIVWIDDSQTVSLNATKRYGAQVGCLVTVEEIK